MFTSGREAISPALTHNGIGHSWFNAGPFIRMPYVNFADIPAAYCHTANTYSIAACRCPYRQITI